MSFGQMILYTLCVWADTNIINYKITYSCSTFSTWKWNGRTYSKCVEWIFTHYLWSRNIIPLSHIYRLSIKSFPMCIMCSTGHTFSPSFSGQKPIRDWRKRNVELIELNWNQLPLIKSHTADELCFKLHTSPLHTMNQIDCEANATITSTYPLCSALSSVAIAFRFSKVTNKLFLRRRRHNFTWKSNKNKIRQIVFFLFIVVCVYLWRRQLQIQWIFCLLVLCFFFVLNPKIGQNSIPFGCSIPVACTCSVCVPPDTSNIYIHFCQCNGGSRL